MNRTSGSILLVIALATICMTGESSAQTTIISQCVLLPPISRTASPHPYKALVIGNKDYGTLTPLSNPVNDATDVGQALTESGFEVTRCTNLTRVALDQAIIDFLTSLDPQSDEVALFYYTGHGAEIDGVNYIFGVDFPKLPSKEVKSHVALNAYKLQHLLERLSVKQTAFNIVILDACRDNPFASQTSKSIIARKGFSPMLGARGTYIAFASAPGQQASDGFDGSSNSPFAAAFLKSIGPDELEIDQVFRLVREEVWRSTTDQSPWSNINVVGSFYMSRKGSRAVVQKPAPTDFEVMTTEESAKAPAAKSTSP
ncbi:caspase family protein [Corallococcus exercitus]|uniref:caspase family protein n=1 Tax=Corallococcus exercitus TaxID=2316736 RepID=UPI000EA1B920|nr:caspase family protein [Corallococcus exercitus]RKG71437.1 caspase family protein [Corallococcus exercitus]